MTPMRIVVQRLDYRGAPRQHGGLVDGAFVGQLALVDRRRLFKQQKPFDAGRGPAGFGIQAGEQALEEGAYGRAGQHLCGAGAGR